MERLDTSDLEIGVTDALQRHVIRQVAAHKPISQRKLSFEARRPRILQECMAEAIGVFFYVFPGIASVASFTLHGTSPLGVTAFGSIFQIGWAFAMGIALAIITCGPTSGAHFNPAITICFAIWQGFPWKKVPCYIASQIFGAFIAGLLLIGVYWPKISAYKEANLAEHGTAVFNGGAASILCSFPNPNQTNLGYLFMLEFCVDSFIGIVISACLDPANPIVSSTSVPYTIGLAYANIIWGFATNTISTNLARDLGTRVVAAIFFGSEAFSYMNYSWIAIVVNVPATIFATTCYEFLMRDSLLTIAKGQGQHEDGTEGLHRLLNRAGNVEDMSQKTGSNENKSQ
jgi:glycerol uptake facilitator-like aquaporin